MENRGKVVGYLFLPDKIVATSDSTEGKIANNKVSSSDASHFMWQYYTDCIDNYFC